MSTPLSELAAQLVELHPEARASAINAFSGGLDAHLGLRFTWCDEEKVVATLKAERAHTQVYGLVHGGVYCSMVEAVGSCGAAMRHLPSSRLPVGVENQTEFRRGVRAGAVLTAVGTPFETTEHGSVWQVEITDQSGRLCASGRLTTRALPPGTPVGGRALRLPSTDT